MADRFDVIVIGVGAMGASACWHLARRHKRVLGIEQFDILHALGSSHGQSRLIRLAYFEHPDYVPLLRRAYELWRELEAVSGQRLLHITGGLYIGRPDCQLVRESLRAAREHGLAHEMLSRDQMHERFPQFHLDGKQVAFYEPAAGFLLPEKCIIANAQAALRAGAEIHGRETVLEWSSDSSGVSVRTDRSTYSAGELIFTAGPWTGGLLRDFAPALRVTRQVMAWFWPTKPDDFALGTFPIWALDRDGGGLFYGVPLHDGDLGMKVAVHVAGEPATPLDVQRNPLPSDLDEVRATLGKMLPNALGPLLSQRVCLYTNSPDGHFILGRHPRAPRVTLAAGFSGHGFKFASVIGEALADLATRGSSSLPIKFLSPARFK